MHTDEFQRTRLMFGDSAMEKLMGSHVAVFGAGGVGGFVLEALARSGIGKIDVIDKDKIDITNINRQIIALHSTIGEYKADVIRKRIKDINPNAEVNAYRIFYTPETSSQFDFTKYDYVVDAIDTVTAKIELVLKAKEAGVPVISSMGAGKKLDPTKFQVADIYETSVCPLAKVMRRELKNRGVNNLKVVFSKEPPFDTKENIGSVSFVPSVVGLIIAGEVIKDLIK